MMFPYIPHLILTGLMGIHCKITTVSRVSVKAGDSISIPCLYDSKYRDNVKYLCQGHSWRACSDVAKTNQINNSGKFSISDDPDQTIFKVAIHNLTVTDRNYYYWCAVEKPTWDEKQDFQLDVTSGMPSLSVDRQEVSAFEGGSVTVLCHYKSTKATVWCKLGSTCVKDENKPLGDTMVTVDTSVPNVFKVTMSKLKIESSGWYWCKTDDIQMPVHVTVNRKLTATTTTAVSPTTTAQHTSLLTSAESLTTLSSNSSIGSEEESLQDERMISTELIVLITILSLLLCLFPAAIFGWRVLRRSKFKPERFDNTPDLQAKNDPDVCYSTIAFNQHVAAQKKQNHIPEDSVIYSSIVFKESKSA